MTWSQVGQNIPHEADTKGDYYSYSIDYSVSVSSNGSVIAIGDITNDGNGKDSGHVRIFKNVNDNWVQIGKDIDGEAAGDSSGEVVCLSNDGSIVAISARYNSGNGPESGHVRVFKNFNDNWVQIGKDIDGEAANDSIFSISLSSDGNTLAVGAAANNSNGGGSGHVRVFKNVNNNWVQIGKDIDGEAAWDSSGHAVSLSNDGSTIAIGAPLNDGIGGYSSGHVRVYKNNNSRWEKIGDDIDGKTRNESFGTSVSLSSDGSILAIGRDGGYEAYIRGLRLDFVRVYKNENNNWIQIHKDIQGVSDAPISLSDDGSKLATGNAIYKNSGTNWEQIKSFETGKVGISADGDIVVTVNDNGIKIISDDRSNISSSNNTSNDSNQRTPNEYETINGTNNDDSIVISKINKFIDGGGGIKDKVIYDKKFSDFIVSSNGIANSSSYLEKDFEFILTDKNISQSNDIDYGVDTITNVELFSFSDQIISNSRLLHSYTFSSEFYQYKFYKEGSQSNSRYKIDTSESIGDYSHVRRFNGETSLGYSPVYKKGLVDITGVPSLIFPDKRISAIADIKGVFDQITGIETDSGKMFRLYNAAFARFPDPDGLRYWIDKYSSGENDDRAVASSFLDSNEFIERFGENISDATYINTLYKNVLGRDADNPGMRYWLNQLNNGNETKYEVLLGFSESSENKTLFSQLTGYSTTSFDNSNNTSTENGIIDSVYSPGMQLTGF